MVVVLFNCFHWVGYHLTRQLLHNGHEVVGVDLIDDTKKEQLYMYVGRNSHFQHFNTIEERFNHSHHSKDEPKFLISDEAIKVEYEDYSSDDILINFPPLFGEFMDMEEKEIDTVDDLKIWILNNGAVYIEDFLEAIIHHLENGELRLQQDVFQNTSREEQPPEVLERIWMVHKNFRLPSNKFL